MKKIITILATILFILLQANCNSKCETLVASQDTFIWKKEPAVNYGNITNMYSGIKDDEKQFSLIKFDISSVPNSRNLVSAKVSLQIDTTEDSAIVSVYDVIINWKQDTATWNSVNGTWNVFSKQTFSPEEYSISHFYINDLAQRWIEDQSSNNGILLSQSSGRTNYKTSESNNKPEILICYE